MEYTTLYEIIQREIQNDDEDPCEISDGLKDFYNNSSTSEQTVINDLFVNLTGWSFETLLEKEIEENEGNEDTEICTNCDGTGRMADYGDADNGIEETEVDCNYCNGTGYIEFERSVDCV